MTDRDCSTIGLAALGSQGSSQPVALELEDLDRDVQLGLGTIEEVDDVLGDLHLVDRVPQEDGSQPRLHGQAPRLDDAARDGVGLLTGSGESPRFRSSIEMANRTGRVDGVAGVFDEAELLVAMRRRH